MSARSADDIVLYSFFPWNHDYPSTAHGLGKALAKYARVWFVSKPPTWKDALRKPAAVKTWLSGRLEQTGVPNLTVVHLPPTLPINSIPAGAAYDRLRGVVDASMNHYLGQTLLGAGVQRFHWINLYAPTQFIDLKLHREPISRTYYSVDAIGQAAYTGRHGVAAEAKQVRASDRVLATSTELLETMRKHLRSRESGSAVLLPNAMDAAAYLDPTSLPEPADLAAIPHPRIGYLGNLDGSRIDYAGLLRLATARPNVSLVLIGPWNAGAELKAKAEALPNVYLLGSKAPEVCPAYLRHLDVGIIPFACNILTKAIYPLKVNEYLASGLPVLSTPFSADIESFGDVLTLSPIEAWPAQLDLVLAKPASLSGQDRVAVLDARRSRAAQNSWDNRATLLLDLISPAVPAAQLSSAC